MLLSAARFFNIRPVLVVILLALIATVFWTQSRYPSLDEKAIMSGAIQLEDPMSFEVLITVEPHHPVWLKILYTTINWINTNLVGMTFGVLFGAGFLTLLRYLRKKSFSSSFMNSATGLVVGAPLGVCVNCAAPIAKGLYSGGARAETTLSVMIASPTFNAVVLTMLFSLLPFYMAVAKIAISLVVILLVVPLVCRLLPKEQLQLMDIAGDSCLISGPEQKTAQNLKVAALDVVQYLLKDLWFILRVTVPLMFLAGLLGAIVATLVPLEGLSEAQFSWLGLFGLALIGTFLPVPIAFDVVVSGALLNGGLAPGYVMALLFTLGVFSIYSFIIVSTTISWRAAWLLGASIVGMGFVAGAGADRYHKWQTQRALDILSSEQISFMSSAYAAERSIVKEEAGFEITMHASSFQPRSAPSSKPFTRTEAWHIGIDKPLEFSFKDMWPPFWEGRSISAGDFDNDGDADVVLASSQQGLYAYQNNGSGSFTRYDFSLGELASLPIFNAVLVDINNDGWLDLFITSYSQGNFVLWNRNGTFDADQMSPVLNRNDAKLVMAVAFGDIDSDGDLDAALGNWAAGWYRRIPGDESRNRIIINDDGKLSGKNFADLPGMPGETLSILFTDMNLDGELDLLVGNDFEQPDIFYFGDGKGKFRQVKRSDNILPATTTTTMSIKSSDLNNDGQPEIYFAQIAGRSSGVSETLKMQPIEQYCHSIEREYDRQICQTNIDIKSWYKAGNQFDPTFAYKCGELKGAYQEECKAMLVKDLAIQNDDASICDLILENQKVIQQLCSVHFIPRAIPSEEEYLSNIAQILRRNVLMVSNGEGTFEDRAVETGLDIGGWSWDVKIADFDNDELQDVYVVNGTWVPNEVTPSNLYFTNKGNMLFEENSGPTGLEDYLITAAATSADFDNDGDLDLIAVTVNGPVVAFINNTQSGNAIAFGFDDHAANRFGIGNRVEIYYGKNGELSQMRELQTGGGFMSFDAPQLHFGLGPHEEIKRMVIKWSNGGSTALEGPFPTGHIYTISRHKG